MISNGRSGESSLSGDAAKIFCANLSKGMHAAAQPLTVLLASLNKFNTDRLNTVELRELTASSAVQVQRVCTFFNCLQQLVLAESTRPDLSPTLILPLLAFVVDGVTLLFQKDEMSLSSTMPESCQPVLIDRVRTLQALTSVLLIAHGISRVKDTVELIASSSIDAVQIVVRNVNSSVREMTAEEGLHIAVAEANMRSQNAGFILGLQPFSVQIELEKVPSPG
jgi:hypothetical protein